MKDGPRILYLARWYPNRYDPMPGLFIQRHAEAASKYCRLGVVYTHAVEDASVKGYELDYSLVNGVPTAKVYYNNSTTTMPILSQLMKANRFFRANRRGVKKIKKELGGFDLLHIHILTRLGLIGLWFKIIGGKPYVISEHWSRYLSLTGEFKGGFRKWITRIVVKNASAVTTVTRNLSDAMQSHGLINPNYKVLANVVTDTFFAAKPSNSAGGGKKELIHVSCFEDKSKNVSGLLRVIKELSRQRNDFNFTLVGDGMDFGTMKDYAQELAIDTRVLKFTGLLENKALVSEMAGSDLMVIFSNYENFPVVINESFVLGIPVFATRVGGIPEYIDDNNGRLLERGDEAALLELLNDFLEGKLRFDNQAIRKRSGSQFSPVTIGKDLFNIYESALKK